MIPEYLEFRAYERIGVGVINQAASLYTLVVRYTRRYPHHRCSKLESRILADADEGGAYSRTIVRRYLQECPNWPEGQAYLISEYL